jgi:Flp pilus assembly protein TadD
MAAGLFLVLHLAVSSAVAQPDQAGFEAVIAEGVGLLKSQRYAEAEAVLNRLQEQGHNSALLSVTLGLAYQGQGRHEEAIVQFRRSLELDPAQPRTHAALGTSLLLAGRPEEAIRELETAAGIMADDPTLLEVLARAYLDGGRLLEAAISYQKLAAIRPDDPEIAYHLGQIYLELTEWSFDRLIEAGQESARVHQAAGQASLMRGDFESAEKAFQRAIKLAPELPDLHLALASAYLRQGKLSEALAEVNAELKIIPANVGAQQMKARLEQELEK